MSRKSIALLREEDPSGPEYTVDEEMAARVLLKLAACRARAVEPSTTEMGDILIEEIYDRNFELERTRYTKHATLKKVLKHCGDAGISLSRTYLANALQLAIFRNKVLEDSAFHQLGQSHRIELVRLDSPKGMDKEKLESWKPLEHIEALSTEAKEKSYSVLTIREKVAALRGVKKKRPSAARALAMSCKALADQHGTLAYGDDDVKRLALKQQAQMWSHYRTLLECVETMGKVLVRVLPPELTGVEVAAEEEEDADVVEQPSDERNEGEDKNQAEDEDENEDEDEQEGEGDEGKGQDQDTVEEDAKTGDDILDAEKSSEHDGEGPPAPTATAPEPTPVTVPPAPAPVPAQPAPPAPPALEVTEVAATSRRRDAATPVPAVLSASQRRDAAPSKAGEPARPAGPDGVTRFVAELVKEQARLGVSQCIVLGVDKESYDQGCAAAAPGLRIIKADLVDGPASWKKLRKAGLDLDKPAVVVSIGGSERLSEGYTMRVLRQIASLTPGSTLAMTFKLQPECLAPEFREEFFQVMAAARTVGKYFVNLVPADSTPNWARSAGFQEATRVTAAELAQRYFKGRPEGLATLKGDEILVATV